jgi:hypothetical protein
MAVAACLLSIPLTVWVVSGSHAGRRPLAAPGEALPTGVTPLAAPAEWPQDLPMATAAEPSTALADRPGEAVAPVGRPQAEPSRPHDVAPPPGSIALVLERQARGDLRRLAGLEDGAGSPMGRVVALFTFLEQQACAGGACQAAQRLTEAYVRARAALLRDMLAAFLASAGEYDGAREQQALRTLHGDYTAEMATLAAHVPMLRQLPDILATTLRVPDYLEAPEDNTGTLQ